MLGASDLEIARLRLQHIAWSGVTSEALDRSRISPGDYVLDAGSGPGFVALELAHRVGETGHVVAMDRSLFFLHHLNEEASRLGHKQVQTLCADLENIFFPKPLLDAAFLRWTLMFLRNPERAIENIARGIKPGGAVIAMEYFDDDKVALSPADPLFTGFYQAAAQSLRSMGGEPSIGAKLPTLLSANGFSSVEVQERVISGGPGSSLWEMAESLQENLLTRLTERGELTGRDAEGFRAMWKDRSGDPASRFSSWPLKVVIGRK